MNKFFTKIVGVALGLAMAIGVGVAVSSKSEATDVHAAGTEGTLTITRSNFPSGSLAYGTTDDFSATATTGETITGQADLYSTATQTTMQSKNSNISTIYHNVTPMPGPITKIEITGATGTTSRNYTVYASTDTVITSGSVGTSQGQKSVSAGNKQTWTIAESSGFLYWGWTIASGASQITEIKITYVKQAAVTFDSITLSGTYPTTFTVGDTFSHAGMVVTANYTNQDDKIVTADATWSTPDMSTAGQKTVTVSYTDTSLSVTKSDTYNITVNNPKTVSSFTLLGGVSSGDTIKVTAPEQASSVTPDEVYYLLKFSDNSYGAANLSWDNTDGLSNVDHYTNTEAGDDNGGYVEPTFTKNGIFTLTLSYGQETPLVVTWKVKGFPTISYIDDTLTPANISNPSSYSAWSGKTKTISGINSEASYSGYSNGGTTYLQMRASDSGIFTTVSGGKISKVSVVWNSSTIADRHILVYGSNSAFSQISDMDNSAVSKADGDIYKSDDETEFTFTSSFSYVGVRIFGGAIYLDSITFTWAIEEAPTDTLKSIEISGDLSKKTYYAEQSILTSGLTVTATFEDDEEQTYTSDVTADAVWNISYPTAQAEDEGKSKDVTFEASFTSNNTTKTDSVVKTINVSADSVTALSWGNRGTIDVFAGTTLGDAVNTSSWTFTPTWASGKADTPTWGTGDNDVHIALYDTATPSVESETKLTASSVLQAADNGKYIVAFYQGCRTNSNATISVTKWRTVIEEFNAYGTYDFSSMTSSTTAVDSLADYYSNSGGLTAGTETTISRLYKDSGCLKPGSGSYSATMTITFASTVEISSVSVVAKRYSESENSLTIMGNAQTLTDSFETYTFSVANGDFSTTNVFSMNTTSSKKRAFVESITINASGEQYIGKTADCLGLETFIDGNLHMNDYTENKGWCLDTDEHHYYSTAKAAYSGLNAHQKSLFTGNSAYAAEFARLSAWAEANGDTFNAQNSLVSASRVNPTNIEVNGNTIAIVVIISMISITCIGGVFFLRKRREN